jgi:hypothetical protein
MGICSLPSFLGYAMKHIERERLSVHAFLDAECIPVDFDAVIIPSLDEHPQLADDTCDTLQRLGEQGVELIYIKTQVASEQLFPDVNTVASAFGFDIPIVVAYKEIDEMDNLDVLLSLRAEFRKLDLRVLTVCKSPFGGVYPDVFRFPASAQLTEVPSNCRLTVLHKYIGNLLLGNEYDIILVDACDGFFCVDDNVNPSLLPFEIVKCLRPDYTFIQMAAGDYGDFGLVWKHLLSSVTGELDAVYMGCIMADSSGGERKLLHISQETANELASRLCGEYPVFSRSTIERLCASIVGTLRAEDRQLSCFAAVPMENGAATPIEEILRRTIPTADRRRHILSNGVCSPAELVYVFCTLKKRYGIEIMRLMDMLTEGLTVERLENFISTKGGD